MKYWFSPNTKQSNQWLIGMLVALLLVSYGSPSPAAAQTSTQPKAQVIRQEDRDNDGQPDLTIVAAAFATARDQVRVYDNGHDMRRSDDWHVATDFANDTWIFDRAGDGSAQLVIQFTRNGNTSTATIYTDQNSDGIVSIDENATPIAITEPKFAPLRAIADGGWFLPDGQLNWNVRFQTDGNTILHLHTYDLTDIWNQRSYLKLDGNPDIELEFHDQNRDGIPEYGLWRLLTVAPQSEGSTRSWIWANEGLHHSQQPTNYVFWPYLITENLQSTVEEGKAKPQDHTYFDTPPIISVSFDAARIRMFAFQGYPIEQGFHVNTFMPFEKGKVNYADFENMQAYYDLADDHDGEPELHIRHRYFGADDLYNFGFKLPTSVDEIRWSWNQTNQDNLSWDYKLGLAGRHTITTTVQFADMSYLAVPFRQLPTWVNAQSWDYATFVAREQASFQSTEGIYLWGAVEQALDNSPALLTRYLAGDAVVDVNRAFQSLPKGWRGDVAAQLGAQPYLYFSPFDHKLHLRHASSGVWAIDNHELVHYRNLNADAYLDEIIYTRPVAGSSTASETKQLDIAKTHLIYSDNDSVVIRQAAISLSDFETLPPTDHQEWAALAKRLGDKQANFAPGDFRAMMRQFDAPEMAIRGATLRGYHPSDAGGFRFIMTLKPGYQVDGSSLFSTKGLLPGDYIVTFDGKLSIIQLTAAKPGITLASEKLTQWQQNAITLKLQNQGGDDLRASTLELWATSPQGQATLVTTQTIALAAQEARTTTLHWSPARAGRWSLAPRIRQSDGSVYDFAPTSVDVAAAPAASSATLLLASTTETKFIPMLIGFAGFVIMAALLFYYQWGQANNE